MSSRQVTLDSIHALREASRDKERYKVDKRVELAKKAQELSRKLGIDSTLIKSNRRLSVIYFEIKDFGRFKKVNEETLGIAIKMQDSLSIAKASFNLGNYFYHQLQHDSAYFHYNKAKNLYIELGKEYHAAGSLLNIAILQKNEKDFIGSQGNSIQAIRYLEPYFKTEKERASRTASGLYNNLAMVAKDLGEYDNSTEYYKKAIFFAQQLKRQGLRVQQFKNNLANVYESQGDLEKARSIYAELLKIDSLYFSDTHFYGLLLNNFADVSAKIDKHNKQLPTHFMRAYKIRDSIDDKGGVMRSSLDMGAYYLSLQQLDSARKYARQGLEISDRYKRNDDELEALLLLSKIEEGEKAVIYAHRHIALNDSLQKEERAKRNKFARIQFETDSYIKETERLSSQRGLILSSGIALVLLLSTLYLMKVRHSKTKELQYVQEQQRANEEIYELMLGQHNKLEEGRQQERHRISEELHDSVLGKLFGTRMSLGFLKIGKDPSMKEKHKQYIQEMQQVEKEIRTISHELKHDLLHTEVDIDQVIAQFMERTSKIHDIECQIESDPEIPWEKMSSDKKVHLYRIVQEATHNAVKHAKAKILRVALRQDSANLILYIDDDGVGFDTTKTYRGIGLRNMASRVAELEGNLEIDSIKGTGTHIKMTFKL